jgi:hypothetical protein
MAKVSPIGTAFNGGEVSPLLDGRTDYDKYPTSCRLLQNYIPLVQGPVTRRPGFRHVAEVKDSSDRGWLIPFVFSSDQAFVLEFGDGYLRFYANRGQVVTGAVTAWSNSTAYTVGDLALSGGVNYYCIAGHTNQVPPNATYWYALTDDILEVPTPWTAASLTAADGSCAIEYEQTGDVVRIIVPGFPVYKLSRLSNIKWTLEAAALQQGPFLDQNATATTLYASAQTGTVTITASAATFAATDVGRYILLAGKSLDEIKMWEPGKTVTTNDLRRVGNRVYKVLAGTTTGTIQPTHTEGARFDGDAAAAVQWAFQDAGYGWARITAFTSATAVSALVISQIPAMATGSSNATARWEFGRFSATTGYPTKLTFFRERLVLASDQVLCLSVAGDFDNFADRNAAGLVVDDQSITHEVGGAQANKIQWVAPSGKLLVGTTGAEFVVGELTTNDPLGPSNIKNEPRGSAGSRAVRPEVIDGAVLHVQRAGRGLRESLWSDETGFGSRDMNVLAEHIFTGAATQMAYQAQPWSVLWVAQTTGLLVGMTYDREQNVYGWHRHPVGGTDAEVESVCCIPSPDNGRDDLWVIVKRTIDGGTVRYVEYLADAYSGSLPDAVYMDSSLQYSGVETTTISGLDHLEGETVQVLADGATHPDRVVMSGAITLQRGATKVQVGLGYSSRMKPMRIDAGAADGTAQGKTKRVHSLVIRLLDTLGLKFGPSEDKLDDLFLRSDGDPMDAPPPVISGDTRKLAFPGGYETDGNIVLGQDLPFPQTIVAIMPQLVTQDR